MTCYRPMTDEQGIAMLEFVLVLPFIWVILALCFNFGQALLERQRALVAVREVGMRHLAGLAVGQDDIAGVVSVLAKDTLAPRQMSASFRIDDARVTCPGEAVNDSEVRMAFSVIGSQLKRLSSTHEYEVSASGPALVGRWLPRPTHTACFALDSSPWTYAENGGYGGMVTQLISELF